MTSSSTVHIRTRRRGIFFSQRTAIVGRGYRTRIVVFFERYSRLLTLIFLYLLRLSFLSDGVSGNPSVSITMLSGDNTRFCRFTSVATRSKKGLKSVSPSFDGYSFLRNAAISATLLF